MTNRAWVTLATNDSYGLGALVLAHSLRRAGSVYPAVVLITPAVTDAMKERLRAVFAEVMVVDVLDSRDATHLALLQRPELGITFTKIHCWNLTQYEKCVFLDADILVVQNCDELFDREELSAAPDVGWPDCFNTGVFVYKPTADTFSNLIRFAAERGSFDGGDQGLLNSYFSDWAHGDITKHLPFLYNVTSAAFYSYLPALKHYGQNLKIIHFIGAVKPWLQRYNWESRSVEAPEHLRQFLQLWWDLFVAEVHPHLDTAMVETEEVPLAIHQQETFNNSEPTINYTYYEPTLDPDSEFPWHHPENQHSESQINENDIDMSQFHDPWNVYKGHIPANKDDRNIYGSSHQEERYYAWENNSQNQDQRQTYNNNNTTHSDTIHSDKSHEQHFSTRDSISYSGPSWQTNTESIFSSQRDHSVEHNHHQYQEQHFQDYTQSFNEPSKHPDNHHHHDDKEHETQHNYNQNHHEYYIENVQEIDKNSHDHNTHIHKHVDILTSSYSEFKKQIRTEQVYTVMMDHIRLRSKESEQLINGCESDADSDIYEEIRPRHPYDGFYLRHRMTVDSRGRKICSHEIPFLPPPIPTSESSEEFEDAVGSIPEDINDDVLNGEESQTGVAGNLARVVPGAPLQREAVDELARRQGWEAGNIDYMGADSFDNIWAKISQTLNQPQSSPQEAPVEVPRPAETEAPVTKSAQVPSPAESAPTDVPIPASQAAVAGKQDESIPVPVETTTVDAPLTECVPSTENENVPSSEIAPATESESDPSSVNAPSTVDVPSTEIAPTNVDVSSTEEIPSSQIVPTPVDVPSAGEVPIAVDAPPTVDIPPTVNAPSTADIPTTVESAETISLSEPPTTESVEKTEPASPEIPVTAIEALKLDEPPVETPVATPATEETPGPVSQEVKPEVTEEKLEVTSDSPPLANTPSKEEIPEAPAAKSEERRKPAGKLQLRPPVPDPLPTPDSELEDAAALAHAIIASELRAPTVTAASPPAPASPPAAPAAPAPGSLSVRQPEVPTPPVDAVSLSQIGVKPKAKPSTAALIESSVSEQSEPVPASPTTPSAPSTPEASEAPKKKVIKKVVKKEKEGASGEAPVPPPRKKEKKPKEK